MTVSTAQPAPSLVDALGTIPMDAPYYNEIVKTASRAVPADRRLPPAQPGAVMAAFDAWRRMDPACAIDLIMPLMPDHSDACMTAALIASVPSPLSFHNHHHVREVVCLAMLMAQGQPLQFQRELFIAACIHDFGHDGHGNRISGGHVPMRLERQALEYAYPYLRAAGLSDDEWLRIAVMVLATDVSKSQTHGTSPSEWLRRALRGEPSQNCPPDLLPLFDDETLCHQAAILEDADLGTSAALPYEHATRMTALIAAETGTLEPAPKTLINFLQNICHGAFLTREALELFGDNAAVLLARARGEAADTVYKAA